jgi:Uma2 family endonuclease
MFKALFYDAYDLKSIIRERERLGIDIYDEVWDGVYVLPSVPKRAHQKLVHDLDAIFDRVVVRAKRGESYPGRNVSDRRTRWKRNYRIPDVLVVLKNSHCIDLDSHIYGGPDFVVEIQNPGDDTEEKIPLYSKIRVQELLIVHRDKRRLRLFRHDGEQLILVKPSEGPGGRWLVSEVLSLAFRRVLVRGIPKTQVRRTDGKPGRWTV